LAIVCLINFRKDFPTRFFNAGIAEANMITMAAGMASEGLRPYCYTIAPFVTSRAYEQIKLDLGYHHLPVVLIGTGAGLSYASLGATHHSLEDVGIMRTIPGMQILSPGDSLELESLLDLSLSFTNPSYIRIGKKGEPTIHSEKPDLQLGKIA
jgi:transketolase